MVAQPGADFFDAVADVGGVGEAVARKIDLIDVQRVAIDQRPKRLAAAFSFAGGDRHGRAVAEPGIAVDVVRAQRLFEPFDALNSAKAWARRSGRPGSPRRSRRRSRAWRHRPEPFAGAAHQVEIERFALAHRLPAELDGLVAGFGPAAADVGGLRPSRPNRIEA